MCLDSQHHWLSNEESALQFFEGKAKDPKLFFRLGSKTLVGIFLLKSVQLLQFTVLNIWTECCRMGRRQEKVRKNAQLGNTYYRIEKYSLETFFIVVKLSSSWINWWIGAAHLLKDLRESLGSTEEYSNTVAVITITTKNIKAAE